MFILSLSNVHFFEYRTLLLYRFQVTPAGVKDRRYCKVHSVDKVCTEKSKVGYLQVSEGHKALL